MSEVTVQRQLQEQDPILVRSIQTLAERVRSFPSAQTAARTFLVGGMVRDLLRGIAVNDADVEVYGIPQDELFTLLQEIFPGRVHDVGKAFGVFKVTLDGGHELDVSLPRRDSKTGAGHKGFDVQGDPFLSIEDAACRRDFTINSLLADPLTGEVMDPFGGIEDLEKHILRITDANAFGEDPLRVYRAVQFAARFELTPEPKTLELLKQMVARGDLDELPAERVTAEIRKLLLLAEKPSIGFELALQIGIIERDYPELHALIATPQEPEWHPEGNVWIHTLMTLDCAAQIIRRPNTTLDERQKLHVMLGVLCHDLGKPSTTQVINGRVRSLDHEGAGEAPTKALLARWAFGSDTERDMLRLVKDHLKPGMLHRDLEKGVLNPVSYANAVRRLLKRIRPVPWQTYAAVCEADFRGRDLEKSRAPEYPAGDLFAETIQREGLDVVAASSLLTGQDLIALGVSPGPEMGRIIQTVEDARDEGKVRTKKEAIEMARGLL